MGLLAWTAMCCIQNLHPTFPTLNTLAYGTPAEQGAGGTPRLIRRTWGRASTSRPMANSCWKRELASAGLALKLQSRNQKPKQEATFSAQMT